eukprot:snap_masked-scaffold_3-processed-gene-8.8-mRNA-1 protein AED:0.11 eAED:1.00 QI:0/-1/0/1/-1/1/1/0/271
MESLLAKISVFGLLWYGSFTYLPVKARLIPDEASHLGSYLTSFVHSSIITVLSVPMFLDLLFSSPEQQFLLFHPSRNLIGQLFLGYTLQDLIGLFLEENPEKENTRKTKSQNKNFETILHHLAYLCIGFYGIQVPYFAFPFCWMCLGEMSTPFLNLHQALKTFKKTNSPLYKINGILLLLSFFMGRVVLFSFGLGHMFYNYNFWAAQTPLSVRFFSFLMIGPWILNLLWFSRMIKMVQKNSGVRFPSFRKLLKPVVGVFFGICMAKGFEIL